MTSGRIAVTGLGVVSPLGHDAGSTFEGMCTGRRAIGPVTLFDTSGHRAGIAAEVLDLSIADIAPRADVGAWSRADALAVAAAHSALSDAGLDADARPANRPRSSGLLGISVGATAAGMFESERTLLQATGALSPEVCEEFVSRPLSDVAARVRSTVGVSGPSTTVCCACSSGAAALVQGASWIRGGRCDRVLVGGVDALCQLTFAGFNSLCALDIHPCRPFDASRNGLSLGEGSAFLVLESEFSARARDARVLAWLAGWAIGSEAHHITRPEPSGDTAARLLRAALQTAGLDVADIAYVNAHGTGTTHNDAMEAQALHSVFGDRTSTLPVSSSKGSIGHTLGAAGAIEAAVTVLAIDRGSIPPSVGCSEVDRALGLHVPTVATKSPVGAALSSSFGFGGAGCVLAFTEATSPAPNGSEGRTVERIAVTDWARTEFGADADLSAAIRARGCVPRGATRRFDRRSQTAVLGVSELATDAAAADTGLVLGTAYGSLHRTLLFLADLSQKGPRRVSPAEFPHLLPSAAAGNASIALGLRGPVLTVLDGRHTSEAALEAAMGAVELGLAPRMVTGASQTHDAAVASVSEAPDGCRSPSPRDAETDVEIEMEGEPAAWVRLEAESHAVGRGAPVHAWISSVLAMDSDDDADVAARLARSSRMTAPRSAERSVVFSSGAPGESSAPRMLEETSWRGVPVRSLPLDTGTGEVTGLRLVTAALDSLASREIDEALVCTRGDRKVFVWQVTAGSESEPGAIDR